MQSKIYIEPDSVGYEIRDGMVHFTACSGDIGIALVTTISGYRECVRKGQRMLDDHDKRQREILSRLPRGEPPEIKHDRLRK